MAASSVANSETFKVTTPSDREITLTRLFDAPRRLIFEAMTKPEHVRRWWGVLDDRHTLIVCEIDLRVGGAWRFVGRGPNGEYAFHGVYHEITPPDRLAYTEFFEPHPEGSLVTTILSEEGGKTRMTVAASYPTKDIRDFVLKTGMEHGAAISYDNLEAVAQELTRR